MIQFHQEWKISDRIFSGLMVEDNTTAKALPDRPLVNGKTGKQLIFDWLEEYNVMQYISDITYTKPRAEYYIDDKAIEFKNNWLPILKEIL